jgi:hypothetical protein
VRLSGLKLIFFQNHGPNWCRKKHCKYFCVLHGLPQDNSYFQFINYIAGKKPEVAEVGHDLTTQLCPKVIDSSRSASLSGRRLVLVDTPGFDDTCVDDTVILHRIGLWLETMWVFQDWRGSNGI